ncbi:protein eiger isoform X2 [Eupeodes corollae]|uniref:protein eiger isoform X2 n=1 Tax=Eupeodes corollae TaxID=290404 RepID=UPI00248FF3F1|nr:protein eiger isoform X2 [Eupeodes corollae]
MTAESLKPFISLPSSADNFSTKKKSSHSFITIGLSASFMIVTIVLLGFTIWNSIRVCELQKEVDSLNKIIGNMQKRLGLHYLDDLSEMEDDGLDNVLVDDPNPYTTGTDDDEDDDNSDEDEEIKTIPAILEDYDDGDIVDGSGLYDDDEDDEDMGDSAYDSGFEDVSLESKKKRVTRSISSSSNGIPIYEDSYALKRNRTGGPDDERIEKHLLANKSPTPTLRPRSTTTTTTEATTSVIERRGRYKSASSNMLRSLNTPRQRVQRQQHRNRRLLLRPLLKSGGPEALTALPMPHPIAVHYHLNNTISGKHVLHPNHNKLPHDGDVYIGSPHPWARTLGMDKAFSLNHGVLTVKEGGVYFVYAQIYYDNRYDRNGFVLYHNVQPFLQCALFVPTNTIKSHTCYTSGVIYLESNDELHLRDIHQDRVVMLTNAKSFFGVIKLGEI